MNYQQITAFIDSLLFHLVIVILLWVSLDWVLKQPPQNKPPKPIIQAVALDEQQLQYALKSARLGEQSKQGDQHEEHTAAENSSALKPIPLKVPEHKSTHPPEPREQLPKKLPPSRPKEQPKPEKPLRKELEKLEKQQEDKYRRIEERKRLEQQRIAQANRQAKERELEKQRQVDREKKRIAELKQKESQRNQQRQAEKERQAEEKRKERQAAKAAQRKAEAAEQERQQAAADRAAQDKAKREGSGKKEGGKKTEQQGPNKSQDSGKKGNDKKRIGQIMGQIASKVRSQWVRPSGMDAGLSCVIRVRLVPGGAVGSAQIVKSSGNAAFDQSAVAAVRRASPLPVPKDMFEHFRSFNFRFRP